MKANIPTDWNIYALLSKTIHLIEIDSITSDSVYTHVEINDKICCAKLDTGTQINVMTESLFKCIGKINKLLLYLKLEVKLVGYGIRNIEYIGTTEVDVAHLTQTKKAAFYVTKLNNDKVILGLRLCIDCFLYIVMTSVGASPRCWHETKKIGGEFPIGVDLQQVQQDILPPVPTSTKHEGDDVKQQIMDLYPDLFSGVGTIKPQNLLNCLEFWIELELLLVDLHSDK